MDFYPLYDDLFAFMRSNKLEPWLETLIPLLKHKLQEKPHGDLKRWLEAYHSLPVLNSDIVNLDASRVGADSKEGLNSDTFKQLEQALRGLIPWRKGPYDLFGVHIDTEWRSDWKWERIKDHITPLKNRIILDVGCGSGYHCWRMLGEGAQNVIGIDPNFLFLLQFETLKK
ncbi:DUF1698 domain-containing protein, partial [Oleiphilus sp. HI0123]